MRTALGRLVAFGREREGVAAVEFALLAPLVLVVVFGGLYLWFLFTLQDSLSASTYRAARYVSVEGEYLGQWPQDVEALTRDMVARDMARQQGRNLWLQARAEDGYVMADQVTVRVYDADGNPLGFKPACTGRGGDGGSGGRSRFDFAIETRLALPAIFVPTLGEKRLILTARHVSYLECGQTPLYYDE
ncbi:MAG: pilus assembly protein [Anaerolineae bacterium]|nr:pilus assembly protein [Anaerolineae bacterium]